MEAGCQRRKDRLPRPRPRGVAVCAAHGGVRGLKGGAQLLGSRAGDEQVEGELAAGDGHAPAVAADGRALMLLPLLLMLLLLLPGPSLRLLLPLLLLWLL
jgi:hypothetical protein